MSDTTCVERAEMSNANDTAMAWVRRALARDARSLGQVSAALWALCGRTVTSSDVAWARRLWGTDGPQRLWEALWAAGALTGQPAVIVPQGLAALIACWAGIPELSRPESAPGEGCRLVVTLPPSHLWAGTEHDSLRQAAVMVIEQATTSLVLCSPYLDRAGIGYLLDALRAAALRGVAITVITQDLHDFQRPNAQAIALLRQELQGTPVPLRCFNAQARSVAHLGTTLVHAKLLLADERIALISSANVTGAGLGQNIEVGVIVTETVAAALVPLLEAIYQSGVVDTIGS
jgi:PLD-like domain